MPDAVTVVGAPGSHSRPDPSWRASQTTLRRVILLALLFSFGACLAIDTITVNGPNYDLWWHLRSGAWIAQHHHLPATDPFSAYGRNKPLVDYTWLFELTLYGFYQLLGLVGPAVLILLVVSAVGFLLYRAIQKRSGGFALPIALTAAGMLVMMGLYTVRPWLFTILFFVIEIDVLFAELIDPRDEKPTQHVWLLPLLFAVWANVHVQFLYGLAVLGLAALTQDIEVARGENGLRIAVKANPYRYRLWFVTGLSFLATLFNPYTWHVYFTAWELGRERVPLMFVSEMNARSFRSIVDYILIVIILGAAFVLGRERFRSRVFAGSLLVCTTLVSMRTMRDGWFVLLVALLLIAAGSAKNSHVHARDPMTRGQRVAAAVLAVLFVFVWAKKRDLSNAHLEALAAKRFPVKAAAFVLQKGFPGPLYNDYDWGGYLIWRLPQLPVSVDGRAWVYGDAYLQRSIDTWDCKPGWKSDPQLASANLVVGPTDARLSTALKDDDRFQLAYQDKIAVVFVKRER